MNPPAIQEVQQMQVWSLGWEGCLEKEMATRSSILAWKTPWTGDLVGHSAWGCKESDMTEHNAYKNIRDYFWSLPQQTF